MGRDKVYLQKNGCGLFFFTIIPSVFPVCEELFLKTLDIPTVQRTDSCSVPLQDLLP